MVFLILCFIVFLSFGLFLILASVFHLPTMRTTKAIATAGKEQKKAARTLDMCLMDGAILLSRYIHMNPQKRTRLANTLQAANFDVTPEVYHSYAIIKTASLLLGIIPCLMIFPIAAIFLLIAAVMLYFKEIGKAEEKLRAKKERIEEELFRFVSTIEQELKNSRDVLSILETYKKNAGNDFARELEVVCADMRSSNYEAALTRFEARLNSPQLSDIVRGLIGVLRGDDSAIYFQMLAHDFKQAELQHLKAKAQKIPPKIRKYSFAMLMCFLITYLLIIGYEVIKSMSSMM